MGRKVFYIYNPQTLSYDRVYPSTRKRIFTVLRHFIVGAILGVGFYVLLNMFIDSPLERVRKKEINTLHAQYELLTARLNTALDVMTDIQQRDNNLYRVILQADPISSAMRNAGIGNEIRYKELIKLPDADLVISTTRKTDWLARQLYVQSNSFDELMKLGRNQEDRLTRIPAIQPISNKDLKNTASGYGHRIDPIYKTHKFHQGMDFSAATGTPVYATGNGVADVTGWQQGYGNTVEIDHGYGYRTRYAHLNKILVKRGQTVVRGEEIAEVGNTGKSTGPHLHYEVIFRGKHENPINYYFYDLTPAEYDQMIQIAENQGRVMD